MADRETTVTNAYQSTLTAELSAVAGTAELADVSALVAPFYLVIEPDDAGQREYVYVSALSGTTATLAERYLAGSAAPSGLVHPSGAVVRHAFMAQHLVDINDRVDAFSDHSGGTDTDDHPEATPSVRGFMSATDKTKLDGIDAGAKADHGGLAGLGDDDHGQYLKDKAAGGLASEVPNHDHSTSNEGGGVDHGQLNSLVGTDHHTQYLNSFRHSLQHQLMHVERTTIQSFGSGLNTIIWNSIVADTTDTSLSYDSGTGIFTVTDAVSAWMVTATIKWENNGAGTRELIIGDEEVTPHWWAITPEGPADMNFQTVTALIIPPTTPYEFSIQVRKSDATVVDIVPGDFAPLQCQLVRIGN